MADDAWYYSRFLDLVQRLPPPSGARYDQSVLCRPEVLVASEGELEAYYWPLSPVPTGVKVYIVGITPGWTQMELFYRRFREEHLARPAASRAQLLRSLQGEAAFAGMRKRLVEWLDCIHLNEALGIASIESLFAADRALLQTGSIVEFPVFVAGKNYSGDKPKLLRSPMLRTFVESTMAARLSRASKALVVPLGNSVSECIEHLCQMEILEPERCLLGFPHPSGINSHGPGQFRKVRDRLRLQVDEWFAR